MFQKIWEETACKMICNWRTSWYIFVKFCKSCNLDDEETLLSFIRMTSWSIIMCCKMKDKKSIKFNITACHAESSNDYIVDQQKFWLSSNLTKTSEQQKRINFLFWCEITNHAFHRVKEQKWEKIFGSFFSSST